MHRSRLGALVVDCQCEDLDAAATFWGEALGLEVKPRAVGVDERYRDLEVAPGQPTVLLQRVEHESRVHLDIYADDIDAEAARLEALGARRIEKIRRWWVMEAPTGHRFCVVQVSGDALGDEARVWNGPDDGVGD